jgi:CheY-like chemotaxis protein
MTHAKVCLLIDDDHDDQLVFSIAVKRLNKPILCITADNGLIALRKLEHDPSFKPDFIFLDLNLPGLNGIECLIRIKEISKLSSIPVVIYTTSSRAEDILTAKNLGAFAFITKPDDVTDVAEKLKDFF